MIRIFSSNLAPRSSVPVSVDYNILSPELATSSNNTSNNSLLNLFHNDSENVTPSPTASPFKFGPLPPSPYYQHPPPMESIMEVTETGTTSSEHNSSPRTEIQILEEDTGMKNEKPDKVVRSEVKMLQGYSCHCGGENKHKEPIDICSKIQEVTEEERKIKEYQTIIRERQDVLKSFVDCHIDDHEVFRRYVEEDEIFRKYIEKKNLFQKPGNEDEDLCDCPAHVHDKENPLELVKVSIKVKVFQVNELYFDSLGKAKRPAKHKHK